MRSGQTTAPGPGTAGLQQERVKAQPDHSAPPFNCQPGCANMGGACFRRSTAAAGEPSSASTRRGRSPYASGLSLALPYWQSEPAQRHCCTYWAQHWSFTKPGQAGRPPAGPGPGTPWAVAAGPPGGAPGGAPAGALGEGAGPPPAGDGTGDAGGAPWAPDGALPAAAPPVAPAAAAHLLSAAKACMQ